ncbi:MAG: hypothetical protein RJB66_1579 [Pseudomonadota bacterium]|jgi:alpha-tubulin suppressor-like RCC1 family protein
MLRKVLGLFSIYVLVGCTEASTVLDSLKLSYPTFSVSQYGEATESIRVNSTTHEAKYEVSCQPNSRDLMISFDDGQSWVKTASLNYANGNCSVVHAVSSSGTSSWPIVSAMLKIVDNEEKETDPTKIEFVAPSFDMSSLSAILESGAQETAATQVSLSVLGSMVLGSRTNVAPDFIYITNVSGCASGGVWRPFSEFRTSTFALAAIDTTNTAYVKLKDLADNESSCFSDSIVQDSTAPAGGSLAINNGAIQTTSATVTLNLSANGSPSEMKINNTDDCTGPGVWEAYQTSKSWELPDVGQRTISINFRDAVGNVSTCSTDQIFYDNSVPKTPTSLTLGSGLLPIDTQNPISVVVNASVPGDTVHLYTDVSCSTEVAQGAVGTEGHVVLPVTLGSNGHFDFYAQVTDTANLSSGCSTATVGYTYDTQAPTVSSVTSSTIDGSYTTGALIDVSVNFNETVNVVGSGATLVLDMNGTPQSATYVSGSGTSTLHFQYLLQFNDFTSDLDYESTNSLQLGSATIRDLAGNLAQISLPTPGAMGSLSYNKEILVNASVSLSLAAGFSAIDNKNPLSVKVTGVMKNFVAKIFSDNSCSNYLGEATSSGGGFATVSFNVPSDGSWTFYSKIRSIAGVETSCSLGSVSYQLDTTVPTVTNVASSTPNGAYGNGSTIDVSVSFSEPVNLVGTGATLALNLNGSIRSAQYVSGSGTDTLHFEYTIVSGDFTVDVDYQSTAALSLGSATLKDAVGNAADTTLASPGGAGSLGANKEIAVNHVLLLSLGPGTNSIDNKNPVVVRVTGVMTGYTAHVYSDATCNTDVGYAVSSGGGIADISVNLTGDGPRTFYAKSFDLNSGASPCSISSINYRLDTGSPIALSVTSSSANDSYSTGSTIDVSVVFSEPVYVAGSGVTVALDVNGPTRYATYFNGSGTDTLHFQYTVDASDLSPDLDYTSINALSKGSATIRDLAGYDAVIVLPAPAGSGSLRANKDIKVNYFFGLTLAPGFNPVDSKDPVDVKVTGVMSGTTIKLFTDSDCTAKVAEVSASAGGSTVISIPLGSDGARIFYAKTTGSDNIESSCSTESVGYTLDTVAPTITNVTSTTPDGSYLAASRINVAVEFSEPVFVTGSGLTLSLDFNGTNKIASYVSGSGTNTLQFEYITTLTDFTSDLDYSSNAALVLGSAQIADEAGNTGVTTLPLPGAVGSLANNKEIGVNDSVTLSLGSGFNSSDNKNPLTVKVTGVMTGHTAKLYTDSSCSTSSVAQATALSGGLALVPVNLSTEGTHNFYAKIARPSGAESNCFPSTVAYHFDQTGPAVIGVTSANPNGSYSTGSFLNIAVTFNEPVVVAGSGLVLNLNMNGTSRAATYLSGSGTETLYFQYLTVAGDFTNDLDYVSTTALDLGSSTLKDSIGNNANTTLAEPGAAGSLGANKAITVNYNLSIHLNAGFNTTDNKNPLELTVGGVMVGQTAKVYSDNSCTQFVQQAVAAAGGTVSFSVNLSGDGLHQFYAKVLDTQGNSSNCTTSGVSYTLDRQAPTVANVTSSSANGNYTEGSVLNVSVVFSEAVTVAGTGLVLNLNMNGTTKAASYVSGTGTSTLQFQYMIANGDFSSDLDYESTTALVLGSASIKDSAGNDATLTLAAPGAANSLGVNKAISVNHNLGLALANGFNAVDTKSPVNVVVSSVMNGHTAKIYSDNACTVYKAEAVASAGGSVTVSVPLATNGAYTFYAKIFDLQGASSSCSTANVSYQYDTQVPTVTSVTSTTADGNHSTGATIDVSVDFSEAVDVTGTGLTIDLDFNGVTRTAQYISGTGSNRLKFQYTLVSSDLARDLDYVSTSALSLGSATVKDSAGNIGVLTLPAPGTTGSLAFNKALSVNYVIGLSLDAGFNAVDNKNPVGVNVSGVMTGYTALVYTDSACTGSAVAQAVSSGNGSALVTVNLTGDGDRTFYAKVKDLSNVESACSTASVGYRLDTGGPTVANVTSTNADGNFETGDLIDVSVTFTEPVTVVGSGVTLGLNLNGNLRSAIYSSGSGTDTLHFNYFPSVDDFTTELEYSATSAINRRTATIKDAAGYNAILTLPTMGAAGSLGYNKNIKINTNVGITLAPGVNAKDNDNPVNVVVSGVMTGATAKVYTESTCTNKVGEAVSSGNRTATVSVSLTGDGARTFYAQVRDIDNSDTACSTASVNYELDTQRPIVTNVTSALADGSYSTGTLIDVSITFDEVVSVTGTGLALALDFNGGARSASYSSGSGTNTLHFQYITVAADFTNDLDYGSTSALTLGTSSVTDGVGNLAILTLPAPGTLGSLSANKAIASNDTLALSLASGYNSLDDEDPVNVNVYGVMNGYMAKLYTDTACSIEAGSVVAGSGGTATVQVDLTGDGLRTFRARVFNGSNTEIKGCSVSTVDYTLDTGGPSVINITSTKANGYYTTGELIDISVTFGEVVYVTGSDLQLSMNLNGTHQAAPYVSGSGTDTLHFQYTASVGDFSNDLEYSSTTALNLGSGAIRDLFGYDATTTLPVPGAANSLSANKTIAVNFTVGLTLAAGVTATDTKDPVDIVVSGVMTGQQAEVYTEVSCTNLVGTGTSTGLGQATVSADLPGDGAYTLYAKIVGIDGGSTTCSQASVNYTLNTSQPTITNVTSSSTNKNYSAYELIDISVTFSDPVTVTGDSLALNLNLNGTTVAAPYNSGSGTATLRFSYFVRPGDLSNDLDYVDTSAMTLGTSTVKNALGTNANLTLPAPGAANSLGDNKSISVNHVQTLALGSGIAAVDSKTAITVRVNNVMNNWTAKVFTDSNCSTSAGQVTAGSSGYADVSFNLAGDGLRTFYAQVVSPGGTSSACSVNSVTYTLDTADPTITNVTSTTSDGEYNASAVVNVSVTFSEPVTVTGTDLKLKLKLYDDVEAFATYASGSGTSTLHFNYMVESSHMSADLDYFDVNSLIATSTTVRDSLNHNASLTLPTPGGAGSLAANKDIKLNYTVTASKIVPPPAATYYLNDVVEFVVYWNRPVVVTGSPVLSVQFATPATVVDFTYDSARSTSRESRFTYTVAASDLDLNGVELTAITGGAINNVFSAAATTTLPSGYTQFADVRVNGVAKPQVSLSNAVIELTENGGSGNVALSLLASASEALTVGLKAFPLAGILSTEYNFSSLSKAINSGVTSETLGFTVTDDGATSGLKLFSVQARSTTLGGISTSSAVSLVAVHDDEFGAGETVTMVASGTSHICVLLNSGKVMCHGSNSSGQLGNGTTTAVTGAQTAIASGATKIYAAADMTCAVLSDNTAKCWGANNYGQLGIGSTTNTGTPTAVRTSGADPTALANVQELSVSGTGACAIYTYLGDRRLKCWGQNNNGQVGDGTTTDQTSPVAVLGSADPIKAVATSFTHTCASTTVNTKLYCWGSNTYGALGLGGGACTGSCASPQLVTSSVDFAMLAVDNHSTCGLKLTSTNPDRGDVYCWGSNAYGQLGNGTTTNGNAIPGTAVSWGSGSLAKATKIYSSHYANGSFCADLDTPKTVCWGYNDGEFASTGNKTSPVETRFSAKVSKSSTMTCGASATGVVSCVNSPSAMRRALFADERRLVPQESLEDTPSLVSMSGKLNCFTASDSKVRCLTTSTTVTYVGDGTLGQRNNPVQIPSTNVADLATNSKGGCYVDTGGVLRCWGENYIGDGSSANTASATPTFVSADVAKVKSATTTDGTNSYNTACMLKTDGSLWCWGYNNGMFGLGNTTSATKPTKIYDKDVVDFAVSSDFMCAIVGTVIKCAGAGTQGQLGDDNETDSTVAVEAFNPFAGTKPVQISSGDQFACARFDDNSLRCWGKGSEGQLGNSKVLNNTYPKKINNLAIKNFAVGLAHVCAITSSNELKCFGLNSSGQLGTNNTTNANAPSAAILTSVTKVWLGDDSTCAVASGIFKCWGANTGLFSHRPSASTLIPVPGLQY